MANGNPRYLQHRAGVHRVCSELNNQGIFHTVKSDNRTEHVDVYATSDRQGRPLKIEVRTSRTRKFVTRITQRGFLIQAGPDSRTLTLADGPAAPDFWVLCRLPGEGDTFEESFFVLSHKEICLIQKAVNEEYINRNGPFDLSRGVDRVPITDVERFRDQWRKIKDAVGQGRGHQRYTKK